MFFDFFTLRAGGIPCAGPMLARRIGRSRLLRGGVGAFSPPGNACSRPLSQILRFHPSVTPREGEPGELRKPGEPGGGVLVVISLLFYTPYFSLHYLFHVELYTPT